MFAWYFSRRNRLAEKIMEISGKAKDERRLSLKDGSVKYVSFMKKSGITINLEGMENKLKLAGRR
jgi:hypothetical protein